MGISPSQDRYLHAGQGIICRTAGYKADTAVTGCFGGGFLTFLSSEANSRLVSSFYGLMLLVHGTSQFYITDYEAPCTGEQ
jgi:hypothetical protein